MNADYGVASTPSAPLLAPNSFYVLVLLHLERAERIGVWSYPQSRTFAELLIDTEEDKALRAVLVGMLRESG